MTPARGLVLGLAAILILGVAAPASAQYGWDRREVEVSGVIVDLSHDGTSFLLREERGRDDRFWMVRLTGRTDVDSAPRGRYDPDIDLGRAETLWRRWLRVGQFVKVEGRLLGNGQILAEEITLLRGPGQPVVRPPFPFPPGGGFGRVPPQIFVPQNGAVITTADITVIGRTAPGARVHVDLATTWGIFTFPAGSADVTADETGIFTAVIRPSARFSGAMYRLTVQARLAGVDLPPTSIVIYQR